MFGCLVLACNVRLTCGLFSTRENPRLVIVVVSLSSEWEGLAKKRCEGAGYYLMGPEEDVLPTFKKIKIRVKCPHTKLDKVFEIEIDNKFMKKSYQSFTFCNNVRGEIRQLGYKVKIDKCEKDVSWPPQGREAFRPEGRNSVQRHRGSGRRVRFANTVIEASHGAKVNVDQTGAAMRMNVPDQNKQPSTTGNEEMTGVTYQNQNAQEQGAVDGGQSEATVEGVKVQIAAQENVKSINGSKAATNPTRREDGATYGSAIGRSKTLYAKYIRTDRAVRSIDNDRGGKREPGKVARSLSFNALSAIPGL